MKEGQTKAEVMSRAVEHGALKDAAAALTMVDDHVIQRVIQESKAERLRIQQEAERGAATEA